MVELTSTHTVDGKPAPEFDTYIGGWSGDPYDPSGLLLTLRSDEIGNLSDSYYAEPAYDRLFDEQAGETDQTRRRRLIQQMVGLVQRDLPWLVLDYPTDLQAFRTDRVSQLEPASPKPDGPVVPTFGYEALIDADPVGKDDGDAGVSLALIAGAGVLLAGGSTCSYDDAVGGSSRWSTEGFMPRSGDAPSSRSPVALFPTARGLRR